MSTDKTNNVNTNNINIDLNNNIYDIIQDVQDLKSKIRLRIEKECGINTYDTSCKCDISYCKMKCCMDPCSMCFRGHCSNCKYTQTSLVTKFNLRYSSGSRKVMSTKCPYVALASVL